MGEETWKRFTKHNLPRDSVLPYLATSRDGIHWNWNWVYAQKPMPLGAEYDWGYVQAAHQFITWRGFHWLYFSANAKEHLARWRGEEDIWLAKYPQDRLIGLSPTARGTGTVVTKPFLWPAEATALYVNVEVPAGSSC